MSPIAGTNQIRLEQATVSASPSTIPLTGPRSSPSAAVEGSVENRAVFSPGTRPPRIPRSTTTAAARLGPRFPLAETTGLASMENKSRVGNKL